MGTIISRLSLRCRRTATVEYVGEEREQASLAGRLLDAFWRALRLKMF